MAGKTIKLYIYGEESKFLKSAELSNWSGKAFIGDRKNVPIIQKMDELSSPGIYFLINKNNTQITLYVGEADEVNSRLKNHINGKDWWDSFVCFISKDGNLTKAHVRYLEKRFYQIAKENTTAFDLQNASEPPGSKLPQSDVDDLEEYLKNVIFVLQNLGLLDFARTSDVIEESKINNKDVFYINLTSDRKDDKGKVLTGKLIITNDGYKLLKGSFIEKKERQSFQTHCYYPLRKKIESSGLLENSRFDGVYVLKENIDFNSSSAAAAVVKNRATNGPKEWKHPSGITLDEFETREK
ncbi:MAG: GIY-YIG nuclease family protein [Fibrobacter sp.]|jgi:hypothetical protein|nr:GIY-YIG nuclease family protein [Fibrobacter sp.]